MITSLNEHSCCIALCMVNSSPHRFFKSPSFPRPFLISDPHHTSLWRFNNLNSKATSTTKTTSAFLRHQFHIHFPPISSNPFLTIKMSSSSKTTKMTPWVPKDKEIIDIGGSKINDTLEQQLAKAFANKGDFPKEAAYTTGMKDWFAVAGRSYQTSDEMAIIEATCKEVVAALPSGTFIIDLGAADSRKYEPYVRELLAQKKTCTYVALDLAKTSLTEQVNRAKAKFPSVRCIGLWGTFQHGDAYFAKIAPGARLFLSLGSIFYNAPEKIARERCQEFRGHLNSADRLIVGQDGPSGAESKSSHASYQTKEFKAFFISYLKGIQKYAGIEATAGEAWTTKSKMVEEMHFFEVVANNDMVCKKFGNLLIKKGTTYKMFPSWKRGEQNIHQITKEEGLAIKTLGKAPNSGMRQYLVSKAPTASKASKTSK